jgi:tetratricopeptide (TPR) repeat protein
MRIRCRLIAAFVLIGVCASSAHGGLYSTFSVELNFKLNDQYFNVFNNDSLLPLRQVGTKYGLADWQKLYALTGAGLDLAKLTAPRDLKKADVLTVDQRLNLATCLLRLRRPGDAIEVLRPATKQDPNNFLVMSTFGTAYMLMGDNQTAGDWLGGAASFWRKKYAELSEKQQDYLLKSFKWNEHEFGWYAKCERYHKYLALLRSRESKGSKVPLTFDKALSHLDALFPLFDVEHPRPKDFEPLRFVGESGKFEPGKIAAAEKAKLPKDAVLIVQQLLIWMPDDNRLYWLLGELLNAQGDVEGATTVFSDFLKKYAYQQETGNWPSADNVKEDKPINEKRWLPKFADTYPEVGPRLQALLEYNAPTPNVAEVGRSGFKDPSTDNPQSPSPSPPGPEKQVAGKIEVDWLQALAVGFGCGLVVGLIVARQWREMRRRRQAQALPPAEQTGIHSH